MSATQPRILTEDERRVILARHFGWEDARPATLARIFGVSHQMIAAVLRGPLP